MFIQLVDNKELFMELTCERFGDADNAHGGHPRAVGSIIVANYRSGHDGCGAPNECKKTWYLNLNWKMSSAALTGKYNRICNHKRT